MKNEQPKESFVSMRSTSLPRASWRSAITMPPSGSSRASAMRSAYASLSLVAETPSFDGAPTSTTA
jgi:hypothetical protein